MTAPLPGPPHYADLSTHVSVYMYGNGVCSSYLLARETAELHIGRMVA